MTLKNFTKKLKRLRVHEQRKLTDTSCDIVFYAEDLNRWNEIFIAEFGPPIKKKGAPLPEKERSWISDTGGIWEDQTLFGKFIDGGVMIAKFQPWKDDVHVTLKIRLLKK